MESLHEPVLESAPLAFQAAKRMCRVIPESGESCAWYHGFRQYLRALGLAITPAHHADFLREAFGAIARPGATLRVLVSGAIDYSMLAHVWWATRIHGADAEVTVVDVCKTPLFLNRWYADRKQAVIHTCQSDILSYNPGCSFDVICTNAFFGQFTPRQRRTLAARWHALLPPGGRIFTVTPYRPDSGPGRIGFSARQAQELRAAVLEAARERDGLLDRSPEELADMAEVFAARMRVHPVRSLEEIGDLFGQAGFGLEQLGSAPPATDRHPGLTAPTVSRTTPYAVVIASRA